MKVKLNWLLFLSIIFILISCKTEMTVEEARLALEESISSSEGDSMSTELIEISTSFTIGSAVEAAAEELSQWFQTQIPCSTVTVEQSTITIDFGQLDDNCIYNDHTYAGVARITIDKNSQTEVQVTHEWENLTNGEITLNGNAVVTWNSSNSSRRIVHDVTWTKDALTIEASGDRTQTLINPSEGLSGGIRIDGQREWTSVNGTWQLEIEGIEMRPDDPVPQAGSYILTNPDGDTLTLSFERVDEDTIQVSIEGERRTWKFNVTATGQINEN